MMVTKILSPVGHHRQNGENGEICKSNALWELKTGPYRNRTYNLPIKSRTLYQLS